MLYWCGRCERAFNEEELVPVEAWYGEDKYSSNSSGWYTEDMVCPYCHTSDDLEEAVDCMECTEYFGASDLIYFDTEVIWGRKDEYHHARLCPECFAKIKANGCKGWEEIAEEIKEMEDAKKVG